MRIIFALLTMLPASFAHEMQARPAAWERAARQEAARQGWPGYPDSYQDAFVEGARWYRATYAK